MRRSLFMLGVLALILPLVLLGCEGDDGSNGAPGTSVGTISGTVTNSTSGTPVEGATIETDPEQGTATTGPDGTYSLSNLPAGVYTIGFSATGYASATTTNVSVLAGVTSTEDKKLTQTSNAIVNVTVTPTGSAAPGDTLTATATATVIDGSTVEKIEWSQKNSVSVSFDNTSGPTTNVTLPGVAAYKDELIKVLAEPPGGGTLPSGVPLPPVEEEEYSGGLQNRTYVVAINPYALEEAGLVTLVATVTTSTGEYKGEAAVHAALPWPATTGLNNVPVNVPVILHGWSGTTDAPQTTWNWTITGGATLDNNTSQNPSFTPTAAGRYTVEETVSGASFDVVAGTWQGLITGLGTDGRPNNNGSCFPACHVPALNAEIVNEEYLEWRETGHAEIFTVNLNEGGHYGESCFVCHTVGYDLAAVNNGIDDQANYQAFLDQFFPGGHAPTPNPDNFANMLLDYPNVARLTNIQCENCHGPNNSAAHAISQGFFDPARFSLSSDLCGSCHGEPLRHGRYQQWQLSGHANYELAIDEGDSTSCSRCHTGNGFLVWGEDYVWAGGQELAEEDITWNDNTVHPQTCATCHDPHSIGTTTGETTNATVRISDDTPVLDAGWQALGVGRGAICMVCHNQRRGLTNDNWSLGVQGVAMDTAESPHHGPQADVLMGQSAFFVTVGIPGAHSRVEDTCAGCHMVQTDPPALLSYSLGGTNHTFYASPTICKNCHTTITDASSTQSVTEGQLQQIATLMGPAVEDQLNLILATDNVVFRIGRSGPLNNIPVGSTVTVSYEEDGLSTITTVDNTYAGVRLDRIWVNSTDGDEFAVTSEEAQTIVKANWNYMLVLEDKSGGAHNPRWVGELLAATYDVLDNTDFTDKNPVIKPLP